MSELTDYVKKHTEPVSENGIEVHFFEVEIKDNPDAEELKTLINEHEGVFTNVDLFDHEEHSYIQLGAWIGDQGYALRLMALGSYLELWKLRTPRSMVPEVSEALKDMMAGQGLITITA